MVVVVVVVVVVVFVNAHKPAFGVNVYVVVSLLFNVGDQVPTILFVDVVGKAVIVLPEQTSLIGLNVGVTLAFTVIALVATLAQSPAVGVNV